MIYRHDCDRCDFLGTWGLFTHEPQVFDLYVCARDGKIDTIIARFGNDGPEYSSGLVFKDSKYSPWLVECYKRAIAAGYIDPYL